MTVKHIIQQRFIQIAGAALIFFIAGILLSPYLISSHANGIISGSSLNLELPHNAKDGFDSMSNIQTALQDISAGVLPAVVEVSVVDVVKQEVPSANSPFEFFFSPDGTNPAPQQREFRREGLGSGIIVRQVDKNVYVLTNNHVVSEADEITIKFADNKQYKATLVGKDDKKDLALVTFEAREHIPTAVLGDSNSVQVGDWVLAVGNPLGFDSTVTQGIISAIGRKSLPNSEIAMYTDYFQTDAAINRGNSGGALVNIHGEVIAINTWIASPSGGNVGIGFAIPINNAKSAIEDFITKGKISYGWIGVESGDLPASLQEDLHLTGIQGSFIYGVFKNSPAYEAGILPGDFITRVDGEEINDMMQLLLTAGSLEPGKKTGVELIRYGKKMNLTLQIKERPASEQEADEAALLWPGMVALKITEDIRERLHLANTIGNVIISRVEPHSPADVAGFQSGDIIGAINNRPINNATDFYKAINESGASEIMFKLTRGNQELLMGLVK
ncbi:MAG: Do family serine endopeptidase [Spirochaetales bacterium]|nr:Do family serine endopeptidase [Spirochaetales bacterium]